MHELQRNLEVEGNLLIAPLIRVLVVEDFERWQRFLTTKLAENPRLQVIGQVSDGFKAVQQAQELQPDLILLDIGLPSLNGIEAARRILEVSPNSKILFVSENRTPDLVEKALSIGASGYVLKSDIATDLLRAVKVILDGKRFVSTSLAGHLVTTTLSASVTTWIVTFLSGIH